MGGCHAINDSPLQRARTSPKEMTGPNTQVGLSFLRIADEAAINCQRGALFLIVYISTASAVQHGFDAAQRWGQTK
jgi:hypothetical protein